MAVQTETYANIVARVEALIGDSLTVTELTRLKASINRRIRLIYKRGDAWPSFFIAKKKRRVRGTNTLQHVLTDVDGVDLGEPHIDELFQIWEKEPFTDGGEFCPLDFFEQDDETTIIGYEMQEFKAVGDISAIAVSAGVLTVTTGAGHGFKVGDTFKIEGAVAAAPAPDVNTSFVITSLVSSTQLVATHSYLGTASYTVGGTDDLLAPVAWCSYRTRLAVTYGDGEGETSDIPNEFAEWATQGGYADSLRADGQTEKAESEEAIAYQILDEEMWRSDRRYPHSASVARIQTHSTNSNR